MNLSKTTYNYAEKRNIEIAILDKELYISVDTENNDCSSVVYSLDLSNEEYCQGFLAKLVNCWDKQVTAPKFLKSEKELRSLIKDVYLKGDHTKLGCGVYV